MRESKYIDDPKLVNTLHCIVPIAHEKGQKYYSFYGHFVSIVRERSRGHPHRIIV